jgi:hypothetical protein
LLIFIRYLIGFLVWVLLNFGTFGFAQSSYPGINPKVLKLGLKAYQYALSQGKVTKKILVLVDFTKNSLQKRLWVIDLKRRKVLFHLNVSHGSGSGSPLVAERFSNQSGSRASSLGTYVTANDYVGSKGRSLRLYGLEKGINDAAFGRAIVMHPASYVSTKFIQKYGYTGRSWGCFAINPEVADQVIDTIQDGSVIFAYGPGMDSDPNLN